MGAPGSWWFCFLCLANFSFLPLFLFVFVLGHVTFCSVCLFVCLVFLFTQCRYFLLFSFLHFLHSVGLYAAVSRAWVLACHLYSEWHLLPTVLLCPCLHPWCHFALHYGGVDLHFLNSKQLINIAYSSRTFSESTFSPVQLYQVDKCLLFSLLSFLVYSVTWR